MWKRFQKGLRAIRFLLWVFLILFVAVAIGLEVRSKIAESAEQLESLTKTEVTRYPVTTEIVSPSTWEEWHSYYGQAKATRTQDVTAFEREIVKDVFVQVGDHVKKGQTLITLSSSTRVAKAQASRTGYDEALLNYRRLKELSKKGGVAQSQVDKAYAALKSEEAILRSSQSALSRTELKASIDGVVAARNVEPGEVAETGRPLLSIVDLSNMEAQLMVSKRDIFHINKATPVKIFVDGKESEGKVERVSPEAQSGSGLYPVVVQLTQHAGALPGTYLEGRFLVEKQDNVLVIPSAVVMYRGDAQSVYVVSGDEARKVDITTGSGREGRVVVTSGLSNGERLITSGNRVLYNGAPITMEPKADQELPQ